METTNESTESADVLEELRSRQWPIWHDAALDITAYLRELDETIWAELKHRDERHSTLCWVLTRLDCTDHFEEVFNIAITGDYEAQCHALQLLHNQFAEVTDEELLTAETMIPQVDQVTTCNAEQREILRRELQEILDRRRRAGTVNRSVEVKQQQ